VLLEEGVFECRNCHESDVKTNLITPCNCTGSIQYVHRSCLNQWRAVSPNPNSFTHCDVCGFEYLLKEPHEHKTLSRKMKFVFLVTRDFLSVLTVMQLIICLFGLIVWGIDKNRGRDAFFPGNWSPFSIDYVCGLLAFFFLLGVYGVIVGMYYCCCEQGHHDVTAYNYPYFWGYYYIWFWPYPSNTTCCPCCYVADCHSCFACNGCGDCNVGSGDGNNSLMAILLVVVIVVIVIGAIVGIVFATIIFSKIVHRHMHIVKKLDEANSREVVDVIEHVQPAPTAPPLKEMV